MQRVLLGGGQSRRGDWRLLTSGRCGANFTGRSVKYPGIGSGEWSDMGGVEKPEE